MAKREARTSLDRLFGSEHGLLRRISVRAADGQRIMRIRVFLIELDRLQCRPKTFSDILLRVLTPTVCNHAGADASEPDMGFSQFGVEFARLPEQLSGFQMRFAANVMRVPAAPAHQI